MKHRIGFIVFSLIAGIAAFALRFLQNRSGFESGTGLPIPRNLFGMALVALLVLAAVGLLLMSRAFHAEVSFPEDFSTNNAALLTLSVMGILLMLASGLLEAAAILMPDAIPGNNAASPLSLINAATAILPAIALFPAIAACRTHLLQESDESVENTANETVEIKNSFAQIALFVAPVCLVIRLVLVYRIHSVNPSLEAYYVELLAVILLTLAFFRLSAFTVQPLSPSRFAWYTGLCIVLVLAVMTDSLTLSTRLLYCGGSLTLLGFLLLHFLGREQTANSN